MRIHILFLGFGLLGVVVGCNQSAQQEEEYVETSGDSLLADSSQGTADTENLFTFVPADALWEYQFDTVTNDFKPVKLREVKADSLTAESIEAIMNQTWPNVQVSYLKTSEDTIFIEIPESTVLTQQMGTAGAKQFLVSATYSFTELPDIQYVDINFKEGDHAVPGTYNRNSWDDE